MYKIILALLFCLVCTNASAEFIICQKPGSTLRTAQGDCLKLGVCSDFNNQGLNPACIIATDQEWLDAKGQFKKLDKTIVTGSRVVDWTQSEIDAYNQAQADAENIGQCVSIDDLDVTIKEAFVAWLQVFNSKVPVQYQVTPVELKNQVISNRGIVCP